MKPTMTSVVLNGKWRLLLPPHRQAQWARPHEPGRLTAMSELIRHGDVVYDIGSEEGDMPALWASWGADVVLAEPGQSVWPNIRAVWQANQLRAPLFCWPGFITDRPGSNLDLGWSGRDGWPACADGPIETDHGFCRVEERPDLPYTSIDAIVAAGVAPPTLLTIDVEGAEHLVLAGARQTLADHRPGVFVSVHPSFMEAHYGIGNGAGHIRELMADMGYPNSVLLDVDHEQHWQFRP